MLVICLPSLSFASDASYIYDDTGRLIKVISETGEVATYNYDGVGNLISITTQAISQNPPALYSINPDIVFSDSNIDVTITGANLFTTETITSDNAGISISNVTATDTSITATLAISSGASLGQANISITTFYGSATIAIKIAKLTFNPSPAAVTPGNATAITARIEGLSNDYTISLNNQNPDIVSVPSSLVIPAGGSATLTVNALNEGVGIITAENVAVTIYVSPPFTGETTAAAKPVSVYVEESTVVDGTTAALPVSVYIEETTIVDGTTATAPVSVYIEETLVVNGTTATLPVSVYIEESTIVNGTAATAPVSVYVEESTAVNAITVAPLVSAEISSQ